MMKLKVIVVVFLIGLSSNAQCIVPIEDFYVYEENNDIDENDCYLKDINNVLGKYVGTWKGVFDGKTIELFINRYTDVNSFSYKSDVLVLRYKITNSNNTILEDTSALSYEDRYTCTGVRLDKTGTYYQFHYAGKDYICGQTGSLFIRIDSDPNSLKLNLAPNTSLVNAENCPNGDADQLLPMTTTIFAKQ